MNFVIVANIVLAVGVFIIIVGLLARSMVPSRHPRSAASPMAMRRLGRSRRPTSREGGFRADTQTN